MKKPLLVIILSSFISASSLADCVSTAVDQETGDWLVINDCNVAIETDSATISDINDVWFEVDFSEVSVPMLSSAVLEELSVNYPYEEGYEIRSLHYKKGKSYVYLVTYSWTETTINMTPTMSQKFILDHKVSSWSDVEYFEDNLPDYYHLYITNYILVGELDE
ncbi:hypothetical protein ACSL9C_002815 [Vibrio navarrensis]